MRIGLGILVTAFALSASPAFAINWIPVLKNTPAERFDDEDLQLFLEAGRKALEAPENKPVTWSNPKTKAGGELTVLKSFDWKGNPCKRVRVQNHAAGRKSDANLNVCRVENRWRVVTESQLKSKK